MRRLSKINLVLINTPPVAERPGKMKRHQSVVFARTPQRARSLTKATSIALALGGWLALAVNAAERSPVSASFTPRELDFHAPAAPAAPAAQAEVTPPSSRSQSYLVYVNQNSSVRLQQVQQLEPTAFMRQYQGRSIIQAGVFSQTFNAETLAIKLVSQGIDVRIVNLATGEDRDFVSNYKFYFVVIPAKQDKLANIQQQVEQLKMGMAVKVSQKEQPRSHVRLGPFINKAQAENWKRYLKASGLRKARVYYGN